MGRHVCVGVAWVGAAATVVGFFLPWVVLDMSGSTMGKTLQRTGLSNQLGYVTAKVRHGTKEITGRLPSLGSLPKSVSGVQVPQMANQQDTKLAMTLMEMLTGKHEYLGAKSYAVYLLPGLALAGAAALTLVAAAPAAIGVAALSAAVAAGAAWKLSTTPTETLLVAAKFGPGLWLSVAGYAVLAVAAAGAWVMGRRQA